MNNLLLKKLAKKIEDDRLVEGKIGATLKLKRKAASKTLQNISESHGISISYLSKIENNHMRPNISYLGNVLTTLEINEELILDSLEMNSWYDKLAATIIGIHDYRSSVENHISQRNDYQAKFLRFALDVYFNSNQASEKRITNLIVNIDSMSSVELAIYTFVVAKYYINENKHFIAGNIISKLPNKYIENTFLKVWYYELIFELSLYQASYIYVKKVFNELIKHYYNLNLYDKSKELSIRFNNAKAYFKPPNYFDSNKFINNDSRNYQLSLVFYGFYDDFLTKENKDDLARLYFDDIHNNSQKVRLSLKNINFSNDPFEQFLKEYYTSKYIKDNEYEFLRNTFFLDFGFSQHYHIMEFITCRLCKILKDQHKYKECYLVNERLKSLKKDNRMSLQFNSVLM